MTDAQMRALKALYYGGQHHYTAAGLEWQGSSLWDMGFARGREGMFTITEAGCREMERIIACEALAEKLPSP